MRVTAALSTELFVGTAEHPLQVVAAELAHVPGRPVRLTVEGPGVHGSAETTVGEDGTARAEIPVTSDLAPGERCAIEVTAADGDQLATLTAEFTAAEPGWTMFMVSHFHYDPAWSAPTATWPAATRRTPSCWPRSTTSSRTGTPTPRTAASCAS
jgi:hypothetical protein